MRKIDKSKILSSKYKDWEEALEASSKPHPKHSSSHKHYLDVLMNLLHCQNGICAYTEMSLCDPKHYSEDNWKDGKYASNKPEKTGHLEHFDESLKSKSKDKTGRKNWLWDNLFLVHGYINTVVKGSKPVDYILKPDSPNYDPFHFLKYNATTHLFIPNDENLCKADQARVQYMLDTLGINFGKVVLSRRKHLNTISKILEFAHITEFVEEEPKEFVTAYLMMKQNKSI